MILAKNSATKKKKVLKIETIKWKPIFLKKTFHFPLTTKNITQFLYILLYFGGPAS